MIDFIYYEFINSLYFVLKRDKNVMLFGIFYNEIYELLNI